jgi:hypothetical protein
VRKSIRLAFAGVVVCSGFALGCGRAEGDLLTPTCGASSAGAPEPCPNVWPNEVSRANSDPWLVAHHDDLDSIHPRALVLHFYNQLTIDEVRSNTDKLVDALAEGSRFHGFTPRFLEYEIAGFVDLTDRPPPSGYPFPFSTQLPTTPDGAFDPGPLFGQPFTDLYGIADPSDPSHNLPLCQLFARGLIHEVWLHVGEPPPKDMSSIYERRQNYDASGRAVPGSFMTTAGNAAQARALDDVACPVTVRLVTIVPITTPRFNSQPLGRDVACSLMAHGFAVETAAVSIPYLSVHARPFLNTDLRSRYKVGFDSWRDICPKNFSLCIGYSEEAAGQWAVRPSSGAMVGGWSMRPFRQGCGTVDFPPNARFRWDFNNAQPGQAVPSRCDGYGQRLGPGGTDVYEPFVPEKSGDDEPGPLDCGPAWQKHWRQSIPGYRNAALDVDGRPMKNWWPFLFY